MTRLTYEQEVERDRKRGVRAEALHKLLNEALESLTSTGKYTIRAGDTHRNIDSDGWYELAYYLCNDAGGDEVLYITTYTSYEKDFEDEWSGEYHYGLEPGDIYWYDYGDPDRFRWCLEDMLNTDELQGDLSEDLVKRIVAAVTKDTILEGKEREWEKSLLEGGKNG